jgi:uncharacterized protein
MDVSLQNKLNTLKKHIMQMEGVAIAYSGGVDSTFLLKVGHDILKEKVVAVTARSAANPEREYLGAVDFARKIGVAHVVIEGDEFAIEGFSNNPVNRCYLCKKSLFIKIWEIARARSIPCVLDGTNSDDSGDYRPGMQALTELGVVSPLQEAGMSKDDIRKLSREMDLPTWNKPAFACLFSRFPYGHSITRAGLQAVDEAEQFLIDSGLEQVRVRHHGDTARIEVSARERNKFFNTDFMDKVYANFRRLGFIYVTLDLKGYRTGSMNEVVKILDD